MPFPVREISPEGKTILVKKIAYCFFFLFEETLFILQFPQLGCFLIGLRVQPTHEENTQAAQSKEALSPEENLSKKNQVNSSQNNFLFDLFV